jgi:2-methylisocitrate lyase-like PEP mutase family enzyme
LNGDLSVRRPTGEELITTAPIVDIDRSDQCNELSARFWTWQARLLDFPQAIAMTPTVTEKRRTFRKLHEAGCFVLPNPWNVGSARYLQGLGFKALATTSSGYAHAQGFADGQVSRDMMLAHCREIAAASDVPVNADFEAGYADAPEQVAENVKLAIETGVAGVSIEDSTGDAAKPLYDFDVALARVRAARSAIDKSGGDVVFTGRSEGFICGRPDLAETIRRLKAFADAGADCLYAPGIKTPEEIAAVVKAVAPKPVNFLMASATHFTVKDLADLGVRRISLGGTLARVAWTAVIRAAREIANDGSFAGLAGTMPNAELNSFFRDDRKRGG